MRVDQIGSVAMSWHELAAEPQNKARVADPGQVR
jgi:hypothetical protein